MLAPFTWGKGGVALTPEQIAQRRALADAAREGSTDTSPVAHWTQGAARVVGALSGIVQDRRADKAEAEGLASADEYIANDPVLSALIGGRAAPALSSGGVVAPVAGPVAGPNQDIANEAMAAIGQPATASIMPASLIRTESGGNLNAYNNEVGAGGVRGHGGRGQFGQARLDDAAAAGIIPRMTPQEYANAPEPVQVAVENWHFGDIDRAIDQSGALGQTINGIPLTRDALRAVAHLGGIGGMNQFISTQGRYNPSDSFGTSLMEYAQTHGGGGMSASGQPVPITGGGGDVVGALAAAMSNPWVMQKYGPVIEALMDQQMRRGDAQYQQQLAQADPAYQIALQQAQLDLERARNPAQEPIEVGGVLLDPNTYQPIFDSRTPEAGATPLRTPEERAAWGIPPEDTRPYAVKPGGIPQVVGGASTEITLDMNGQPRPELLGTQGLVAIPDPSVPQGFRVEPAPGSPLALEREQAATTTQRREGNRTTESDIVVTAAQRAREAAQTRTLGGVPGRVASINPASTNAELYRQVDVLRSQAQLGNLQAMREASPTGGALGSVTERELQILADKSGALDPASPNFLRDLDDYERTLLRTIHGPDAGDQIYEATRGGGDGWTVINGVRVREKR